jgi:hypothetical protein
MESAPTNWKVEIKQESLPVTEPKVSDQTLSKGFAVSKGRAFGRSSQ